MRFWRRQERCIFGGLDKKHDRHYTVRLGSQKLPAPAPKPAAGKKK
ncbi:MAG: hypothetical protein WCV00_01965 [Verrucomicrobiia bacterium]